VVRLAVNARGYELGAAGMLIMGGGHDAKPMDCDAVESVGPTRSSPRAVAVQSGSQLHRRPSPTLGRRLHCTLITRTESHHQRQSVAAPRRSTTLDEGRISKIRNGRKRV
jgi:hypothetical protein